MQTLISYVLASNSVGEFRSFDNDKNVDSPTFAIGLAFDWAIRLFHNANTEDALPIDSLQDVTNWSLQFKRANLPDETPLIIAEGCELSQVFDPLANITYTQVTAHLPVTNTEELQRLIDGESSVTLEAELVGYDANSASVFVLQIPSVVWRNRAFASQPTPVAGWITTDMLGNAVVTAPKIGTGAVTTQKIADGAVLTSKIANGSVTAEKIDYLAVTTEKLDDSAVETDKIADSAVVEAKIGTGAVTTNKIGDFSVTSTKIEDYAVTADHIAPSAVTTGKLSSSAVTTDKIADNAVTAAKIAAGAVGSTQLASSAVGTGNIADSAVSTAKIASGAVTADKISAGAVGTDAIASSAVTEAKISAGAVTAGKLADGSVTSSKISAGAVTGDKIADASVSAAKIAGGAVGADKLADSSVTALKIAENAISAEKIMDGAVTEGKLEDSSVSADKLEDGAVTSAKVADLAITTGKLSLGAVGSSQLADASVISTKIADSAISTEKLADDSVTHAKLNHWTPITAINGNYCTITAGDVIEWHLTGDGTMTATKQIGSYGQAKAEIFSNDKTITFNGITLVDAIQPNQINFCTLDFIGNQCNLHVDHQVYGYVVTSPSGTSSGSLAYGINSTSEEYITFRSDVHDVELDGGTIARSVKIIGNGVEETKIVGTYNVFNSPVFRNITIAGTAIIPSGNAWAANNIVNSGSIQNSGTLNFAGVNILNGTVTNLAGGTIALASGVELKSTTRTGVIDFNGGSTSLQNSRLEINGGSISCILIKDAKAGTGGTGSIWCYGGTSYIDNCKTIGFFGEGSVYSGISVNRTGTAYVNNCVFGLDTSHWLSSTVSDVCVMHIAGSTIASGNFLCSGTTYSKDCIYQQIAFYGSGIFSFSGANTIVSSYNNGTGNKRWRLEDSSVTTATATSGDIAADVDISIGSYVDDVWIVGGTATVITSGGTQTVGGVGTFLKADGTHDFCEAYGVLYDPSSSSPACQRVVLKGGTLSNVADYSGISLHAHKWRSCVMDNLATRHVNYYLSDTDDTKKAGGGDARLDGTDGDVMVEIPVTYWKVVENYDNTGKVLYLVSSYKVDDTFEPHPYFYVSPDGQTLRTQYIGKYIAGASEANGTLLNTDENATGSAAYSSTRKLRSVAGVKPFANTNLANARTMAHNTGGQVANALFYQFAGLMMLIETATFNSQSAISVGYSNAMSATYTMLRLSGRSTANGTSGDARKDKYREILADATRDSAINWGSTADANKVIAFQFHGVENPFGSVWQFEEGMQKYETITCNYIVVSGVQYNRDSTKDSGTWYGFTNGSTTLWAKTLYPTNNTDVYDSVGATTSVGKTTGQAGFVVSDGCYWHTANTSLYTSTDQQTAANPTYTKTLHSWPAEGYPKNWDRRTFYPVKNADGTSGGGDAGTYLCDYFYNTYSNGVSRCSLRGGGLISGSNVGCWCVNVYNGLTVASWHYGFRLAA